MKLLTSKPFRRLTFLSRPKPLTPSREPLACLDDCTKKRVPLPLGKCIVHYPATRLVLARNGTSMAATVGKRKISMDLVNGSSALRRDQSVRRDARTGRNKRLDTRSPDSNAQPRLARSAGHCVKNDLVSGKFVSRWSRAAFELRAKTLHRSGELDWPARVRVQTSVSAKRCIIGFRFLIFREFN